MGAIQNTMRSVATGVARHGVGAGRSGCVVAKTISGGAVGVRNFSGNVTQNIKAGQSTPIINECKNVTEGIASGDLAKAAVGAGMVGITTNLAAGSVAKGAVPNRLGAAFISGMSMGMIPITAYAPKKNLVNSRQPMVAQKMSATAVGGSQSAAQVAVAPEATKKRVQPATYRIYKGNEKRARSASPRRMMTNTTRNSTLMPPYFKPLEEVIEKKPTETGAAGGMGLSFHNYKPLL